MLKVHVIYQWNFAGINKRLIIPLNKLHAAKGLDVSFYAVAQYQSQLISKADVIIFSNVIDRGAIEIAEEAKNKGIGLIYDSNTGAGTGPSDPAFLNALRQEEYHDIRSRNVRERLLNKVDLVTSNDTAIVKEHEHIKDRIIVIRDCTPDVWLDAIKSVAASTGKANEICGKKILFISPALMWPHQNVSDMIVKDLMDMGHAVHLFTPGPSLFHTGAVCRKDLFDPGFMKRLIEHMEDCWKIPLLIDREGPDMVITVGGYVIPRQILMEIRKRKVRSAVLFVEEFDDAWRNCTYAGYFTHVFIKDRSSLAFYRRNGNPNTFCMPEGCGPGDALFAGNLLKAIKENDPIPCDAGHYKTGYIQMDEEDDSGSEQLPDMCSLTMMREEQSAE
ncbi:MAG: hypothetical protein HY758_07730, partial [Nitrospirae bacterium]|nr:hypothetical protein [Nitrospirota bacterium]